MEVVSHTPPWPFGIEITNKCPFKCIMCARTHSMTRPVRHMQFDDFVNVIDQFYQLHRDAEGFSSRILRLHDFGESLTHPEFDRFIRYASDLGFRTALSINPLMLTEDTADRLFRSGINTLFVSLDGHNDETFYQIRGVPNAYEKSVKRFEKFLVKRKELGLIEHIELSMIDFEMNRNSISEKKGYWENHPLIDRFRHKIFTRWDGSDNVTNALSDEQTEAVAKQNIPVCQRPWRHVVVLVDGTVVPCCFDYNSKYPLGNAFKESIMDIWNGEPMMRLREEFLAKSMKNSLCVNCERRPGL